MSRIERIENYKLDRSTDTRGHARDFVERLIADATNRVLDNLARSKCAVTADTIVTFTSRVEREVLAALAAIN